MGGREQGGVGGAERTVDAKGAYLLPGMIDFHTHLFTGGSAFGLNGDLLLPSGVTLAVDMGTAGSAGYEMFHRLDVLPRTVKIRSFINLSPLGQPGGGMNEPLDGISFQNRGSRSCLSSMQGKSWGSR